MNTSNDDTPFADLPSVDLSTWPTFLVVPVQRWCKEEHPVQRLWRICDACEVMVRYVFTIGIADLQRRHPDDTLPSDLRHSIAARVRFPSFGAWIGMVEEVIEAHDAVAGDVAESPGFRRARRAFKQLQDELLGTANHRPEDAVLALRNFLAHAGGIPSQKGRQLLEAEGHEQRARQAFADRDEWLANTQLFHVTETGNPRRLRGLEEPVKEPEVDKDLADQLTNLANRVVLSDADRNLLDLTPILDCRVDETPLVYVRKWSKALHYNAFGRGSGLTEKGGDALARFRSLFRDDCSADEADFTYQLERMAQHLVGRADELGTIIKKVKEIHGEDRPGILWLEGRAGMGKSTLMAAASTHKQMTGDPSELLPIAWQFQTGDHRNSGQAFLEHAVDQLMGQTDVLGDKLDDLSGEVEDRFEAILSRYGELKASSDHPEARAPSVVFFLDGLDELPPSESDVLRMPFNLSYDNVIWVCAGRPEVADRFENRQDVTTLFPASDHNPDGGLPPLLEAEIRQIFEERLEEARYELHGFDEENEDGEVENRFLNAVTERADGLPLYAHLVVTDILDGHLEPAVPPPDLPDSVNAYYTALLNRYGIADMTRIRTLLLALLAVTPEPLTVDQLHRLLCFWRQLSADEPGRDRLDEVLGASESVLRRQPTPDEETGYTLYHETFRQHLRENEDVEQSLRGARQILADATVEWTQDDLEALKPYLLRHGLDHLLEAGRGTEAKTLLKDLRFVESACRVAGPRRLAKWYDQTADALPATDDWRENLRLMSRVVQLERQFLQTEPDHLFQQMYNRCWWHDTPEADRFYLKEGDDSETAPWESSGPKLHDLMDEWRTVWEETHDRPWVRALRPLGKPLSSALVETFRTNRWVDDVAITPDGRRFAALLEDKIRVWERTAGEIVAEFKVPETSSESLDFCSDRRRLVTDASEGGLLVWDVESGEKVAFLGSEDPAPRRFSVARFAPVAISDHGTALRVWDLESGKETDALETRGIRFSKVKIAPDGSRFALVRRFDERVFLFQTPDQGERTTIEVADVVSTVAFGPEGRTLAAGTLDGTIQIFDLETGSELHRFGDGNFNIDAIALSPDGATLAYGGGHRKIFLHELEADTESTHLTGHHNGVDTLDFSPDGDELLSSTKAFEIRRWDLSKTTDWALRDDYAGIGLQTIDFEDEGRRLAYACRDHTVRLEDAFDRRILATLLGHSETVHSVKVGPDGQRIATGSADGTVRIWDLQTGDELATLVEHPRPIKIVEWGPMGRLLAIGCDSGDVWVWDTQTGEKRAEVTRQTRPILAIDFSPDGHLLLTGVDGRVVRLTDLRTETTLMELHGKEHSAPLHVQFLGPEGLQIGVVRSNPTTIRVWDLGEKPPSKPTPPSSATLEDDIKLIARLDQKPELIGRLTLPSARDGHLPGSFQAHLTANGKRAITTEIPETTRIWEREPDTATYRLLGEFDGTTDAEEFSSAVEKSGMAPVAAADHIAVVRDPADSAETVALLPGYFDDFMRLNVNGRCVFAGERQGSIAIFSVEAS